jgi:hypothetical protein
VRPERHWNGSDGGSSSSGDAGKKDGGSTSSSGSADGGTDTTPTGDSACGAEADLNGCVSCFVAQGGSCYDSVAAACQKNADCTANQGCLQSQCASKQ